MKNIFFTADTHFGHGNIIRHLNRPFVDAHQMNCAITENWNFQVKKEDTVYHLGDFSFRGKNPDEYAKNLNGKIYLIKGNHDRKYGEGNNKSLYKNFEWVGDYLELKFDNQSIVLSHYPFLSWNKSIYGSWMLHGHCHGKMINEQKRKILDVGVDTNNFFLYDYDTVKKIMNLKDKINE